MAVPKRLAHIVLKVRDMAASERFYTDVVGLKVTAREFGMIFLKSAADRSHELALTPKKDGSTDNSASSSSSGLSHFAWEMESFEALKDTYKRLLSQDLIVGIGDHGISIGIYLLDPDENKVEIFYELPKEQWPEENLFRGKFPLKL